jgi:methylated-DNA-[protein]-cysteine S-methyltransferase
MSVIVTAHDGPLGVLTFVGRDGALAGIYFPAHKPGGPPAGAKPGSSPALEAARKQLDQYFAGRRKTFDLPLALAGTAFQMRVWAGLAKLGFGETISYGALAERLASAAAVRAVAGAVARNPVSIVIPCHRVIGANGQLTGFAGGIDRKRALLGLELGGALEM